MTPIDFWTIIFTHNLFTVLGKSEIHDGQLLNTGNDQKF